MSSPVILTIRMLRGMEECLDVFLSRHLSENTIDAIEEINKENIDYSLFLSHLGHSEECCDGQDGESPLARTSQAIIAKGNIRKLINELSAMSDTEILPIDTAIKLMVHSVITGALVGSIIPISPGEDLESYANKFREAGKKSRLDDLGHLLQKIVRVFYSKNARFPKYNQVIEQLELMADQHDKIIQEVDTEDRTIAWRKKSGVEETISFKQIQSRLTRIRKKYSPAK